MKELYVIIGLFLALAHCNRPTIGVTRDYSKTVDSVIERCLPLSDSAGYMDKRLSRIESAVRTPKRHAKDTPPVDKGIEPDLIHRKYQPGQ